MRKCVYVCMCVYKGVCVCIAFNSFTNFQICYSNEGQASYFEIA